MRRVGWIVQGRRSGEWGTCYMESTPERSPSRGTMGDYGYGLKASNALVFGKASTAKWHASRWFGFTSKTVKSIGGA